MSEKYVRHTLSSFRQATREKIIYPADMWASVSHYPEHATMDATITVWGQSIVWQFSWDSENPQGEFFDVKVPIDRVPGTPLKFYLVFTVNKTNTLQNFVWELQYLIVGDGDLVTGPALTTLQMVVEAGLADRQFKTPYFTIPASEVDGKKQPIQLQMSITRRTDDVRDTAAEPYHTRAYLLKIVMEYTAYV